MEICAKLFGPNLARRGVTPTALQELQPVGACSSCAGDYEDPDRTAWEAGGRDEPEDRGAASWDGEGFSADK